MRVCSFPATSNPSALMPQLLAQRFVLSPCLQCSWAELLRKSHKLAVLPTQIQGDKECSSPCMLLAAAGLGGHCFQERMQSRVHHFPLASGPCFAPALQGKAGCFPRRGETRHGGTSAGQRVSNALMGKSDKALMREEVADWLVQALRLRAPTGFRTAALIKISS